MMKKVKYKIYDQYHHQISDIIYDQFEMKIQMQVLKTTSDSNINFFKNEIWKEINNEKH